MAASESQKSLARIVTVLVLAAVVIGGWVVWTQVISSPERVFSVMLENSLKTRGVTKQTNQSNDFQSIDQKIQLQLGEQNVVHAFTALSQLSEGETDAMVVTESIGTPRQDFVRYVDIQTDQPDASGKPLDFKQVIGVWGSSSGESSQSTGELFGETVLGVVPIGYLQPENRREILSLIKELNVYEIDYSAIEKSTENGRPRYTYKVQVKPENYVTMLKQFAESIGLSQLDGFNPASFKNSPALNFNIKVDVWSKQLVSIDFVDSDRTELLGSYGGRTKVDIPMETIPVSELQRRLQTVE